MCPLALRQSMILNLVSLDGCPGYSLSSAARFEDMASRAAELGFTDVIVHFPRADGV
jgi:hypothetical protein